MSLYIAEENGQVLDATLADDEHPRTEGEFLWRVAGKGTVKNRSIRESTETLEAAANQVAEFFAGKRLAFDVPLELRGTAFQVSVWRALMRVPFGETRSYADLAEASGHPGAFRAVGGANGKNRLPVFVPCHRIIAADGKLGGFTGGLGLKQRLLHHESAVMGRTNAAKAATLQV